VSEQIEISISLEQSFLDRLDAWCRHQMDQSERSVAIIRLADDALSLSETLLRIQAKS
jgi:metal-responsive CopG/Arc/MetJ family transcriptional regulator